MKAIFFPKSEVPAKVCSHRYGADMTYTEQTDTIQNASRYAIEYYAHKHNARVGAFIYGDNINDDVTASEKYGACKFDIYLLSGTWFNPSTKVIEQIPDIYSTVWTQKGIDTFGYVEGGVTKINGVAVSVGSPKAAPRPMHGENLYDYSNGKYGWKNGVFGNSNGVELLYYLRYIVESYNTLIGKYAASMSFNNGMDGGAAMDIIAFLQARNSGTSSTGDMNAETWYGKDGVGNFLGIPQQEVTRNLLMSRCSTTRWCDAIGGNVANKETVLNWVTSLVTLTANNGGWQNNFTHWHNLVNAGDGLKLSSYDEYFQAIVNGLPTGKRIHFANYGEASEYLLFKECIDNVSAYNKGNRIVVAISVIDKFKGSILSSSGLDGKLPFGRINIPISVEVDLSGTFLQGKNVKTNFGKAIDLGNNKIIVELPFPTSNEGVIEIEIFDNITPDWKTVSKPLISNFSESDVISFDTDCPCYSCVFEITNENNITLLQRNIVGNMKTAHSLTFSKNSGKTYAIGIINECGLTNLINL